MIAATHELFRSASAEISATPGYYFRSLAGYAWRDEYALSLGERDEPDKRKPQ